MISRAGRPFFCLLLTAVALAQVPLKVTEQHFRVYDKAGAPSSFEALIEAAVKAEVVLLGESHDDPAAHYLEEQVLRRLQPSGGWALSLEMFERDVQTTLDEYLAGLINEEQFLAATRPWKSYKRDYRPLVEFAREQRMPVIAANAPRRYVNRVTRLGMASLGELSPYAKGWLAPLPYEPASRVYGDKFREEMKEAAASGRLDLAKALESQSLWDATMAFSIAEFLTRRPGAKVLNVNGRFHSEQNLGIAEYLPRYRPRAAILTITVIAEKSFPRLDEQHARGYGDFVIATDPALRAAEPDPKAPHPSSK